MKTTSPGEPTGTHDDAAGTGGDELPAADTVVEESTVATPADTRADFARAAARGYTVVRAIVAQLPHGDHRGSTTGWAVKSRSHRALIVYLLLLHVWPWLKDEAAPMDAAVWVRALQYDGGKALTWSPTTLSRAWKTLEDAGLVTRTRRGLKMWVQPCREDGAADYTVPSGAKSNRFEAYFTLPDCFWREGHFTTLSLPALAMLLITLKETNREQEFYVPYEKGPTWYGISPKTLQNGVLELEELGLLVRRFQKLKAPRSKTGETTRIWYRLTGDYSTDARGQARELASVARATRKRKPTTETSDMSA